MNKIEFLNEVKIKLSDIDKKELKEIVEYYDEIISDAVEFGKSEEEFILSLGSVDSIFKKMNIEKKVKDVNEEPTVKNAVKAVFSIFGIITSPIWIPLVFAFFLIIVSLIITGFAVVISLGASVLAIVMTLIYIFTLSLTIPQILFISLALVGAIIFLIGLIMVTSRFLFTTVTIGLINLFKRIIFKGEIKNV